MREMTYYQAINEALAQVFEKDERFFIMGQGIQDHLGLFGSTLGLADRFGSERVIDIPVAEGSMTGICTGAALGGLRPVLCHARMDFMLVAMDQVANHMAKWHYMFGGAANVPVTIRCIVGKGWGQGAQHSQSLQATLAHSPGLKIVMPATPYDVKGLLISSLEDPNPVIFVEHRRLYDMTGEVLEEMYSIPLGKSHICRPGKDVTVVATSLMVREALRAASLVESEGIDVEVVDPRTLAPLDRQTIVDSVRRTGRLVVADLGHRSFGAASEIVASVVEEGVECLKASPVRITTPDVPPPTSHALESVFFPDAEWILAGIRKACGLAPGEEQGPRVAKSEVKPKDGFVGPF